MPLVIMISEDIVNVSAFAHSKRKSIIVDIGSS